jgi:adenylate cyclase
MALGLGYFGSTVEAFVREQRQSRRLSRFFSPAVLKEVIRARSDVNLGSSRRLLTVLFCDIRGFTPLSERLQPEEVAELLGEYLTDLTAVVFKHGGTVDKYVGDCIMALYNVPFEHPDHAKQAVRTAIEIQEHTRVLSEKWRAKAGVDLVNGVGISTGEAVVGTLGSRQRLEYTAIGDTVNLAARLETLTKEFEAPIIVSESTWALLNDEFSVRPLGTVTIKGKEKPAKIYAVLSSHLQI